MKRVRLTLPFVMLAILTTLLMASFMFVLGEAEAAATSASPSEQAISPVEASPALTIADEYPASLQAEMVGISPVKATLPLTIPDGYRTGLWPEIPGVFTQTESNFLTYLLMDGEPVVTMLDESTAEVAFTTTISTVDATVYYGVYDEDALLAVPRFRAFASERITTPTTPTGVSTQHKVTLPDLLKLSHEIEENGGGLVAYRIEIYSAGQSSREAANTRLYDRRFEFYNGQLVPTISEGPFVDQVTENSAIISWDTDMPVNGTVKVGGMDDVPASNSNDTHFEVDLNGLAPGTTYTYTVEITDGENATSSREYYFRTTEQDTTEFAFVVLGDTRGTFGGAEYDYNGVSALPLRNLMTHAFNRDPDFIIHTGDLMNGYTTNVTNFNMMLSSFKDVMENVGHYIPIYELMGNHEALFDSFDVNVGGIEFGVSIDKEGDDSAEMVFGNHFVNPTNGPTPDDEASGTPDGKSRPPYEENVYYFDHGNARFVAMNNNYWWVDEPEIVGGNLEGYVLDDQLAWLIQVFEEAQNDDSIDHIFLFAQEPMFPNGPHEGDAMWYHGGDPAHNDGLDRTYVPQRRDEIWRAFIGTGKAVTANFGDEHNYTRTYITHDFDGNEFETPAWQIISGGGGAVLGERVTNLPWSDNVEKYSMQMEYTVLRVNGQQVTLEVYNLDNELIESVVVKEADGSISANARSIEPVKSTPKVLPDITSPATSPRSFPTLEATTALTIPDGYRTGLWPTIPPTYTQYESSERFTWLVMDGEPEVTMIDEGTVEISFTTALSTVAATVYYGIYDEGTHQWPRFRNFAKEPSDTYSTQHKVTLEHVDQFSAEIIANGGGVMPYRIEIYNPGLHLYPGSEDIYFKREPAGARFYDRRFEFYNGQLVPNVSEGPFVDQVTENSAIISWDADMPVDGTVKVVGVGDFEASNTNSTHFEVDITGLNPGTTYSYTVEITDGITTTSTPEYHFRTTAQDATEFSFAVMGDSRAAFGGGEHSYNGLNGLAMRNLTHQAFNKGPDFIVHTGDLISGYTTSVQNFKMQFSSFKDSVESVGHYIPIYELMGNHESLLNQYYYNFNVDETLQVDKEGDESAEAIFASQFVNPTNGATPDNEAAKTPEGKSLPPYDENTYYIDHGNSRFVMMNNNYWYSNQPERFGGNLEGYVLDDQMAWLTEVFEEAKNDNTIEHVFLFAQEPMFPNGGHVQDAMWYNNGTSNHPHPGYQPEPRWDRSYIIQRRDEIWRAFIGTGKAVAANFGDEHNYSRTWITHDKDDNEFETPAWQIISGGAGAPHAERQTHYSLPNGDEVPLPWSPNVQKFTTQQHYTLFHVNGSTVMLEVYNIDDQLIEQVELTADPTNIALSSLNTTASSGPWLWQLVGLTLVMLAGTLIIRRRR